MSGVGRHHQQSSAETLTRIRQVRRIMREMSNHDLQDLVYDDGRLRDAGFGILMKNLQTMRLDKLIDSLGSDHSKWTALLKKHTGMQEWIRKLQHDSGNGTNIEKSYFERARTQVASEPMRKRKKRLSRALRDGEESVAGEISEHETAEQRVTKKNRVVGWLNEKSCEEGSGR